MRYIAYALLFLAIAAVPICFIIGLVYLVRRLIGDDAVIGGTDHMAPLKEMAYYQRTDWLHRHIGKGGGD